MLRRFSPSLSKLNKKIRCVLKVKQHDDTIDNKGLAIIKPQSLGVFDHKSAYQMSTQKAKSTNSKQNTSSSILSTSGSAIKIMQSLQTFIQSSQFKKKFDSYYYLQKYSWLCIHTWILFYKMRQCISISEIIHSYLLKRKIESLLEDFTRDQVYQYDEIFDRHIYEELKRRQEVIFWALDQYFVFDQKKKNFGQIIEEDFGLWPDTENTVIGNNKSQDPKDNLFQGIEKKDETESYRWKRQEQMNVIGQYFLSKMSSIQNLPYESIKSGKLQEWLKL